MNNLRAHFLPALVLAICAQSAQESGGQAVYRSYRPAYRPAYQSASPTVSRYPTASRYPIGTRRVVYANGSVRYILPGSHSTRSSIASARGSYVKSSTTRSPYRLGPGDVVAVIVQGISGDFAKAPVHMPKKGDDTLPAVGHPMVVLRDGTLPMPMIDPVRVSGMTVTQARDAVANAYLSEKVLNKKNQVTLSLMRKRTVNISVLHDDPSYASRTISNVNVAADRASVLNALVGSGPFDPKAAVSVVKASGQHGSAQTKLSDGDVVHVKSAARGTFFTGGNLPGGEYALPRGRNVNALQAMSLAGGVQNQGVLGPREVIVIRRGGGASRAGYAALLNNPNALMMMPGDTLIVR